MRSQPSRPVAPLWATTAAVITLLTLAASSLVLGAAIAHSVATHWPPVLTLAAY